MNYSEALKSFPLLSSLQEEELLQLGETVHQRSFDKGAYLIRAQEDSTQLWFIADGEVKITLVGEGREIVLATLGRGEFFGEISLLIGEDRSANVVAVSDVILFSLSKEDFERHIAANTGLSLALMNELAVRLRKASFKIGDLALLDVANRVERTLHSLAKKESDDGGPAGVIESRPTHQELANMVGTSREMVTRALKNLEEAECILVDGKRIEILINPW